MVQFGIELGATSHPASGPAAERPYVRRQGGDVMQVPCVGCHTAFAIAAASLLLSNGCASPGSQLPAAEPEIIDIKVAELQKYWVSTRTNFPADRAVAQAVLAGKSGLVAASIVIGSNGRIVEHEIVYSEPNGFFTSTAERQFRQRRFEPAAGNPGRTSVRLVYPTFYSNSPEALKELQQRVVEMGW
jgi:hypothetical protein